jgi:copper(I)-binding protein
MKQLRALMMTVALAALTASPLQAAKSNSVGEITADHVRMIEGDHCVSMTLTNNGAMIDALLVAKTPIAEQAVLVDQRMHHDVQKIELLPKTPLKIEPGRACIILRNMPAPPKAGDTFTIALTFEHAASITASVSVVPGDHPAVAKKLEVTP